MRAIVIDDSRAMRMIIKKHLTEAGFDVIEATQGAEALDKLRAEGKAIGVALVDWNMPVMNGLEFVENIRKDDRFSGLRILMVTSEAEIGSVERALAAGANEYLMKPFTVDALKGKLELLGLTS
jgi:two-component system, chemotaxis family, chemotaxis protein CheY